MKPMNMKSLAELCGVSVSTVSKAFSGCRDIGEETRERIFAEARKHGCYDHYNKERFGKRVIAVIMPEREGDYYNTFLNYLEREIDARDAIMTVSVSRFSQEKCLELYTYYTEYCKADGVLVIDSATPLVNPRKVPTVAVGIGKSNEYVTWLRLKFSDGIRQAVEHLKAQGHKEIGFVGEPLTGAKLEQLRHALRQSGLPVCEEYFKVSAYRFEEAGVDAVTQWIASGEVLPTAIVAGYDHIAIGVIRALRQNGYRVPEDVAVLGMDDIRASSYPENSLSTVRTRFEELSTYMVDVLMQKIGNPHYCPKEISVTASEFIPRDSTRCLDKKDWQ